MSKLLCSTFWQIRTFGGELAPAAPTQMSKSDILIRSAETVYQIHLIWVTFSFFEIIEINYPTGGFRLWVPSLPHKLKRLYRQALSRRLDRWHLILGSMILASWWLTIIAKWLCIMRQCFVFDLHSSHTAFSIRVMIKRWFRRPGQWYLPLPEVLSSIIHLLSQWCHLGRAIPCKLAPKDVTRLTCFECMTEPRKFGKWSCPF